METNSHRVPLPMSSTAPNSDLSTPAAVAAPGGVVDINDVRDRIIDVLKTCYDPEIPVNIYELGLVYSIDVQETGDVQIRMTLTSPMCPVAGSLPPEVQAKAQSVAGVRAAKVELVWDPPWNQDMMSEAARVQLGFF
jgi:FeS assembly SUF system protein